RDEVHQAPFVVLKSPDIPSILVETGFISNNAEARQLQRDSYQAQIARAVADGSADFLEERGSRAQVARGSGGKEYTVQKGDTLWSIAQQHRVSVDRLKQVNDLRGSTLTVGRNLRIP
ncbi:MAG: LysM peptidoglycan-binding domain-containing protein, partial [Thiohalorhabdaceae bacterium]